MKNTQISLEYEHRLWENGIHLVAGIDEAGRGPFAGPVVAAAVVFDEQSETLEGINDSKKLTPKKREKLYDVILQNAKAIGIGIVEPEEIDRINILQATYKAMRQAVGRLKLKPGHLLIDGRPIPDRIYPSTAIIGGDGKCYSIAAASIIAKVYRDKLMTELDSVFPHYGFAKHKGYGTEAHRKAIAKFGPCPIHRKSFSGVKEFVVEPEQMRDTKQVGKYGEDLAAYYLHRQGFKIVARNVHIGAYGELDIIAQKGEDLCFVEVKTERHSGGYGPPETWVDERKMKQLTLIADGWLSQRPELDLNCRFDVIGVTIRGNEHKITHLPDAFRPE